MQPPSLPPRPKHPVQKDPPPQPTIDETAPTLMSWDPVSRLPSETLDAYAAFRRWLRDFEGMLTEKAATGLDIPVDKLQQLATANLWPERAAASAARKPLLCDKPPWARPPCLLDPLPPDAAEAVRRREWAVAHELVIAAVDAIRSWRESDKPPTMGDLVKLAEMATHLARLAAAMPQEGPAVAAAIDTTLSPELADALKKAYPQNPQPIEVPSA